MPVSAFFKNNTHTKRSVEHDAPRWVLKSSNVFWVGRGRVFGRESSLLPFRSWRLFGRLVHVIVVIGVGHALVCACVSCVCVSCV